MDFNADGHIDIVTGTFDGSPHIALGTKDGFEEPTHILDDKGKRILLGQYWDHDEASWTNLDQPQCTSAIAFDWDDDGDYDLLLGEYGKDGGLHLNRNEGKPGAPIFPTSKEQIQAGNGPIKLEGGVTTPRLVDWNRDGLMDLVIGSFGNSYTANPPGGVYLYLNVGAKGAPEFAAAKALIAPTKTEGHVQTRPNVGLYADPVDVDGDGDLDLIVGGYSIWFPEKPDLTGEQTLELRTLMSTKTEKNKTLQDHRKGFNDQIKDLEGEERSARWKELIRDEGYLVLAEEVAQLTNRIEELNPSQQRKTGVWIYLQEQASSTAITAGAPK